MTIEHITNYVERGQERLAGQFWESPRFLELVRIFLEPFQDVEDLLWELRVERLLSVAEGAQLDQYGDIVGQPRLGLEDDEYRRLIETKIVINRSQGQAWVVVYVVPILVGETAHYQQRDTAHYSVDYETDTPMSADFERWFKQAMLLITPSGVSYEVVETTTTGFRLDDPDRGLDQGELGRRIGV